MVTYTASIESIHSQEEVFDYLADFSSAAQWDPAIESGTNMNTGPIGLGSRFDLVSRFLGREVELSYSTTEIDRPRRFVVSADSGGFCSEDTISVEPRDEGCVVHYHATLHFRGPGRLLSFLWQLVFNKIGAKAKAGLNDYLNRSALELGSNTIPTGGN